jgi:hypothetical protein
MAKLDDARHAVAELRVARDIPTFRRRFAEALSALRSVPEVLGAEGKRHFRKREPARTKAFAEWLEGQKEAIWADPLLALVMNARNADQHEGRYHVEFGWSLQGGFKLDAGTAGRPPNSHIELGPNGPLWVVDAGARTERREPIDFEVIAPGRLRATATLVNAPSEHLGKAIASPDPVTLCGLAVDYFGGMLLEARSLYPWNVSG